MTNATKEKIAAAIIATVQQVVENADDVNIELLYKVKLHEYEPNKRLRIRIDIMPED